MVFNFYIALPMRSAAVYFVILFWINPSVSFVHFPATMKDISIS